MINEQNTKVVGVIAPTALVDAGSWTTVEVDTRGYDYATYYFYMGGNDIAVTVLKIQEMAVSATSPADVSGLVMGTSTNTAGATSVLPTALDDGKIWSFEIDLRPRMRYLDLVATNGNGAAGGFACAWCVLSRAGEIPNTAINRGLEETLRV